MDWQASPVLRRRRAMTAPPIKPLPPLNDDISAIIEQGTEEAQNGYINPDEGY